MWSLSFSLSLNEKGRLLQKAFYWKLKERITHTEISERLEKHGLILDEKRLSGYFRNPFYCGLMAHSALGGKLIEGKHEIMVPKDVFLKVNDLLSRNTQGYSCHEENEPIPLKRFLRCGHCGTPMRGYVIKAKNLPYYKCNTKGCCNNKRADELHDCFEDGLSFLTVMENATMRKMITKQVIAEFNKGTKENDDSKEVLKRQVTEIQKKIDRLEERLILEEITLDLYNKYVPKYKAEILELERAMLKTNNRVSNLIDGVKKVMDLCGNLRKMWQLLPYKDKQIPKPHIS